MVNIRCCFISDNLPRSQSAEFDRAKDVRKLEILKKILSQLAVGNSCRKSVGVLMMLEPGHNGVPHTHQHIR